MALTFEQLPAAVEEILLKLSNIERLLSSQNAVTDNTEFLTIKQTADFTSLSISTLYKATHERKLVHYKRGNRLYFLKDDLIAWIKENRIKSMHEINEEAERYVRSKRLARRI